MKKIWKLLPLASLFISLGIKADMPEIKTFYIYAQGGESLREILTEDAQIDSYTLDELGYYKKIYQWNQHILNKISLKKNERIYVEVPYSTNQRIKTKSILTKSPALSNPVRPEIQACRVPSSASNLTKEEISLLSKIDKDIKKIKNNIATKTEKAANFLKKFQLATYYSISRNSLEESVINSTITTNSNQDSPITLGASFDWQWDPNISFAGNILISKVDDAVDEIDNSPIDIPILYGLKLMSGFKRQHWPVTIYAGFEHDSFSTFNSEEIAIGEDVTLRTNSLTGIGGGIKSELTLFDQDFILHGFYSQTVLSSTNKQSSLRNKNFTGSKLTLDGRMMYQGDWFFHGYYQQMNLEGPTILHLARFGLGFGLYF